MTTHAQHISINELKHEPYIAVLRNGEVNFYKVTPSRRALLNSLISAFHEYNVSLVAFTSVTIWPEKKSI